MAQQIQDDGFHEIQLNRKQLVFLLMVATVVSVVIFLCGVLVGRSVRAERANFTDAAPVTVVAERTPQQPALAAPTTPAGSDPTAPPPPAADLSYFKRLEKPQPPSEELKGKPAPSAESASSFPHASPPLVPVPKDFPQSAPAENAASEPARQRFAVQIAALNVRSEANTIAKRLTTKGYSAYVLAPRDGTPSFYRVRVGKFSTRREAETVAAKLQKEEQLKPWVTR